MTEIITAETVRRAGETMRILTVRSPWAQAILHAGKNVENRARNIAGTYRGPIAIHVALRDDEEWMDNDAAAFIPSAPTGGWPWPTYRSPYWENHGHIIGVVNLIDVHSCTLWSGDCYDHTTGQLSPRCSPWADNDCWHLALANPQPLAEPIAYRGGLGLRRLPADVVTAISAQVTL